MEYMCIYNVEAHKLLERLFLPDMSDISLCRASLEALGVRIRSIHWYSGSSFTTSSSTNPCMTTARYDFGIDVAGKCEEGKKGSQKIVLHKKHKNSI